MKEVRPNLWVGNQADYEQIKDQPDWWVVQACKEPYHREAVGYTGKGAPPESPEYLFAERDQRLILNLVDADTPKFIPHPAIVVAAGFIKDNLNLNRKILVHCNQGRSRAPGVTLAYLRRAGEMPWSYDDAATLFVLDYPEFFPSAGIDGYLRQNWDALLP